MIEIENLTKDYRLGDDTVPVLNGVSLAIAAGEVCALVGASGSGKTTLMNIVGLLDRPSAGRYRFRGQEVSTLVPRPILVAIEQANEDGADRRHAVGRDPQGAKRHGTENPQKDQHLPEDRYALV